MPMTQRNDHIEAEIARVIYNCELDFLGANYSDIRVSLARDLVVVHLTKGHPSPAERQLATHEQGRRLFREMHRALFDQCRDVLVEKVAALADAEVKDVFMDISAPSGEKVIVFTLSSGGNPLS
jgi:uncharacterized protein YbcI